MHNIETKIQCIRNAIKEAELAVNTNEGGPFGAVLVNIDNPQEIFTAHNTVLKDNDPTAHAEVNVIRAVCRHYNTYDLSKILTDDNDSYKKFVLYSSSYPCPMCLGAIKWSGIKHVIYSGSLEDTSKIGFKDNNIYKEFNSNNKGLELFMQLLPEFTEELFKEYNKSDSKIIY